MTLNGVMTVILRYFSEFGYLPGDLRKSSRSLSHLLMSSFLTCNCTGTASVGLLDGGNIGNVKRAVGMAQISF